MIWRDRSLIFNLAPLLSHCRVEGKLLLILEPQGFFLRQKDLMGSFYYIRPCRVDVVYCLPLRSSFPQTSDLAQGLRSQGEGEAGNLVQGAEVRGSTPLASF